MFIMHANDRAYHLQNAGISSDLRACAQDGLGQIPQQKQRPAT
jgi:hypothetical protein